MVWYCEVCHANVELSQSKHNYCNLHKRNLNDFLVQEQENMRLLCVELRGEIQIFEQLSPETKHKYKGRLYMCRFCDSEIDDSKEYFHK